MITIDSHRNITHMRGDTDALNLNIRVNGQPYQMGTGDQCVFSAKTTPDATAYIVQIPVSNGTLTFPHLSTKDLPAGTYYYDIQLTTSSGLVQTLASGEYRLLADITRE